MSSKSECICTKSPKLLLRRERKKLKLKFKTDQRPTPAQRTVPTWNTKSLGISHKGVRIKRKNVKCDFPRQVTNKCHRKNKGESGVKSFNARWTHQTIGYRCGNALSVWRCSRPPHMWYWFSFLHITPHTHPRVRSLYSSLVRETSERFLLRTYQNSRQSIEHCNSCGIAEIKPITVHMYNAGYSHSCKTSKKSGLVGRQAYGVHVQGSAGHCSEGISRSPLYFKCSLRLTCVLIASTFLFPQYFSVVISLLSGVLWHSCDRDCLCYDAPGEGRDQPSYASPNPENMWNFTGVCPPPKWELLFGNSFLVLKCPCVPTSMSNRCQRQRESMSSW